MPKMVKRKCQHCSKEFEARESDVKRAWARFCSKSCKGFAQEKRTGQHRRRIEKFADDSGGWGFTNAHLFSNEEK